MQQSLSCGAKVLEIAACDSFGDHGRAVAQFGVKQPSRFVAPTYLQLP